jgi:hypothetical protein
MTRDISNLSAAALKLPLAATSTNTFIAVNLSMIFPPFEQNMKHISANFRLYLNSY